MVADELPDDVLTLLREQIDGLDDLEVLVFVRSRGSEGCDRRTVAAGLRLPDAATAVSLERLTAAGLLHADDVGQRWTFRPTRPALETAVEQLAEAYAGRPHVVMRIVNRLSLDRLRSSAASQFAAAFVFGTSRRKKDG